MLLRTLDNIVIEVIINY